MMFNVIWVQIFRNIAKKIYYAFNWFRFLLKVAKDNVRSSHIAFDIKIKNPSSLRIGNGTSINSGCFLDFSKAGENHVLIGNNVKIGDHSRFCTSLKNDKITIGDNTSIHGSGYISGEVEIAADCLLSRNIFISSYTHNTKLEPNLSIKEQDKIALKNNLHVSRKVTIESDVWIGWGVVIMPGLTIAKGSVVGANSVLTKNTEPYGIYGGSPAIKIGSRI